MADFFQLLDNKTAAPAIDTVQYIKDMIIIGSEHWC